MDVIIRSWERRYVGLRSALGGRFHIARPKGDLEFER